MGNLFNITQLVSIRARPDSENHSLHDTMLLHVKDEITGYGLLWKEKLDSLFQRRREWVRGREEEKVVQRFIQKDSKIENQGKAKRRVLIHD